ncbi:4-alpha-glucanotransferase [Alkalispirochaeta americana]|uniref:4-alpha-glucanotransferase n=1 Tax=Alkalispirochaeta americana TaxID=159291 RepID=A0A1N6RY22_9SPIO|nr:4-alpha-glucanotransferase [Alkalispirochaeta americana]SIQ33642.1 4-alpha-glucanotransferase [Alkalispirochaeta americana]
MKYPHGTARITGVLVPLAALRSTTSIGCGEFADLPDLARWCSATGLNLIQLLPVNDTGGESSPYSALSAYALHPVYIRIQDLPELQELSPKVRAALESQLKKLHQELDGPERFDHGRVLAEKTALLRQIFTEAAPEGPEGTDTTPAGKDLTAFVRANPWVKPYSVFRALKDAHQGRAWTTWEEHRQGDQALVDKLWRRASLKRETRFYAWVQMRLARQFREASREVARLGVALKGDIPILMNQDSVDAWFNREVFRPDLRAGAPPDMFSDLGQNWGFPIYNWDYLESQDYAWWRERLRQAAQYYQAYRIDHVLGFFRIWSIPERNVSGTLGFFWPQKGLTRDDLGQVGLDAGRLRWLSEPHLRGEELHQGLGEDLPGLITTLFEQIDQEDLFLFSPAIRGEADIIALGLPAGQQEWLLERYRDRALLELPDGTFAPSWFFRDCSRYQTLSPEERARIEELLDRRGAENNELWAEQGRTLLKFMQNTTDMLTCAEDLGVVPEAVPRVLGELGILSLLIPRWSHYWDQPGEPLIPLGEYPEASVCAPSVHDTSTLRGWWEDESGREALWREITSGEDRPCPEQFTPEVALEVYRGILACSSRIVVFQLQDLFALTPDLPRKESRQDRINVPGTANSFNWTWRMPLTMEALQDHPRLQEVLRDLAARS